MKKNRQTVLLNKISETLRLTREKSKSKKCHKTNTMIHKDVTYKIISSTKNCYQTPTCKIWSISIRSRALKTKRYMKSSIRGIALFSIYKLLLTREKKKTCLLGLVTMLMVLNSVHWSFTEDSAMLSSKWRMSLEVKLTLKNSERNSKKSGSKSSSKMTNKKFFVKAETNRTDQITNQVIPIKNWRISCLMHGMLAATVGRKLGLLGKKYNTSSSFTTRSKSKRMAGKQLILEEDVSKLMRHQRIA